MIDRPVPASPISAFVKIGRRIFGWRLLVGLAVVVPALELLVPTPLFAPGHRGPQITGLLLVLLGLALRGWGSGSAGRHTRQATIEAPTLVTSGPFAYVRNPIYLGTMILGLGMAIFIGDLWAIALAGLAFALLYFTIVPAEEEFLARQFGEEYARYRAEVPRLIPRLRPWPLRARGQFDWRSVRGELGIALILIGIYGALLLEEWMDHHWG